MSAFYVVGGGGGVGGRDLGFKARLRVLALDMWCLEC